MSFLSHYLYGGSKSTEGEEYVVYKNFPSEWRPHKRPKSLPLVGRAVIHIGDEGKITNVKLILHRELPRLITMSVA